MRYPRQSTVLLVALFAFLAGLVLGQNWYRLPWGGDDGEALATFRAAYRTVRDNYVDTQQTAPRELVYDAVQGMVEGLGDTGHTRFLTPQQRQQEQQQLSGRFAGIGVEVAERDGRPVVVAALPGSPAARAGLRAGDRFLKVDGQDVTALGLAELSGRLRGPVGTDVRVTVLHADDTTLEVVLTRAEFQVPSVTWTPLADGSVWQVHISQFSEGVAGELDRAIAAARAAGARGLVLDLRDNPGGLLNEAIAVTSRFVEDGVVLVERDRDGDTKRLSVQSGVDAVDLRLVVLVNGGSASAAEVTAAALRYHNRAEILGVTTFGTGTVLREFALPDGSALLLGVQEWLTPAGEPLRNRGLEPSTAIALPDTVQPQIPDFSGAADGAPTPAPVCTAADVQLRAAAVRLGVTCPA